MSSLTRSLYSALTYLAQPLLRRKLRRRALLEPGYTHAIEERFGRYTVDGPHQPPNGNGGGWLWIHAVSLGETRAAAILLKTLRAQRPALRLLLTHSTATGRTEGQKLLQPGDKQAWLPWDSPSAVHRFLQHFRPAMGILMETEVWPNLIASCQQHHIPLVLANARLNEKSYRQAQRLGWLARPAYAALAGVYAQTETDAQRLRALGAPVQGVLGNLKFDAVPDARQIAQGQRWRRTIGKPVLLFASSREGEEALWLQALQQQINIGTLRNGLAAAPVQWLIVPRHPQRFDAVAQLLQQAGLRVSRRSQWADHPPASDDADDVDAADVWLGDSLGEMTLYYSLATVALLGGSFAPLGGQNLIEAAACACPIVLGPHCFNFAEAAQWACAQGGAQAVGDIAQAITVAATWSQDATALAQAQNAAVLLGQSHQGAAQATATAVLALLPIAAMPINAGKILPSDS